MQNKNYFRYFRLFLVKLDTALPADVFENFRDKHKLDPAYFLTTPGLSWEA